MAKFDQESFFAILIFTSQIKLNYSFKIFKKELILIAKQVF